MLPFSCLLDPFIKDRCESCHRRGVRPACGRVRLAGGQGGGQPGEQDVEAAFEFGGAVVGGQDGGQAAEQGEVADREPVGRGPDPVVALVGADGEFLELVEDVAVQEAEQGPVDVQGVGPAEPGSGEQGKDVLERPSGGRRVPAGRSPSGVASGRVTISGTTCGWASASARKRRATSRSWPAQSGSAESTRSWARTVSATPSSRAALPGACR